jgi:hypothetical protein
MSNLILICDINNHSLPPYYLHFCLVLNIGTMHLVQNNVWVPTSCKNYILRLYNTYPSTSGCMGPHLSQFRHIWVSSVYRNGSGPLCQECGGEYFASAVYCHLALLVYRVLVLIYQTYYSLKKSPRI